MNNRLTITSLILIFTTSLSIFAKDIVVNNPVYKVSSSGITSITKIELTEENTKLHIHTQFLPNWWVSFDKELYIEDCDTNKKYYSTEIIGTEYGKKIFMPASGDSTFIIVFPPVDLNTKTINFWSSEQTRIYDISLDPEATRLEKSIIPNDIKEWLDTELLKAKSKDILELKSDKFFSTTSARLVGYIKGYDPRLGFRTGIIYLNNDITRENLPTVITIHADGRFEANLNIQHPQIFYLSIHNAKPEVYIEPGHTLAIILDWNEFLIADRHRDGSQKFIDIEFKGTLAQVNQDILLVNKKIQSPPFKDAYNRKTKEMLPNEYKSYQDKFVKSYVEELDKLIDEGNIGKKAGTILSLDLEVKKATSLFGYIGNYTNNGLDTTKRIPIEFYGFLKDVPHNDQRLLISNNFTEFINRLEYIEHFKSIYREISKRRKPSVSLEKYLFERLRLEKSKEDKEYIELIEKMTDEQGVISFTSPEDYTFWKKLNEAYTKRYKNEIENYHKKYTNPLKISLIEKTDLTWHMQDSILLNELKIEPGFLSDIIKSRSLNSKLSNTEKKEASDIIKSYEAAVSTPFLKKEGVRLYDEKFVANTKLAYDLPEGKGTDVIRKITEPFKGKYVLVDFWSTWCGPCIHTIKDTHKVRKEYNDHPEIAFVFVSDEKISERYTEFVKEQELTNHYNVSQDDFKYLRELFKFNGIPRYILLDKQGKVVDDNFKGYDLENQLKRLLGEEKTM